MPVFRNALVEVAQAAARAESRVHTTRAALTPRIFQHEASVFAPQPSRRGFRLQLLNIMDQVGDFLLGASPAQNAVDRSRGMNLAFEVNTAASSRRLYPR